MIEAATESAGALGYDSIPLVSRAYHDALFMAQVCPTGMIFVPSAGGHSHRPEEYTSPEELVQGIETLALTLSKLAS